MGSEFAHAHGAEVTYIPVALPDIRLDSLPRRLFSRRGQKGAHNLFAFPAQSNFSEVQHPLEWIEKAHAAGWDVLLDAAAFAPTNYLDLGQVKPDFVPLSFYKNVRLSNRRRRVDRAQGSAGKTASSVVRGRDDHGGFRAGR